MKTYVAQHLILSAVVAVGGLFETAWFLVRQL